MLEIDSVVVTRIGGIFICWYSNASVLKDNAIMQMHRNSIIKTPNDTSPPLQPVKNV